MASVLPAGFEAWRPGSGAALPGLPAIIGHRGAKMAAPENTLAAIAAAQAQGARWVEIDVKLTADGTAVLMHDDTLDRTTDGTGPIARTSLAALRALDAGAWFDERFAGERVPTLIEVLDHLDAHGTGLNLEIKPCPGREVATVEAIAAILDARPAAARTPILISSFSRRSLEAARDRLPAVPRGLLVEHLPADWATALEDLGCTTLHIWHEALEPAILAMLADNAVPLLVYTVNEPARALELLDKAAVRSVITDCPGLLIDAQDGRAQ